MHIGIVPKENEFISTLFLYWNGSLDDQITTGNLRFTKLDVEGSVELRVQKKNYFGTYETFC